MKRKGDFEPLQTAKKPALQPLTRKRKGNNDDEPKPAKRGCTEQPHPHPPQLSYTPHNHSHFYNTYTDPDQPSLLSFYFTRG